MNTRFFIIGSAASLAFAAICQANLTLRSSTIDAGGGAISSTGGALTLRSTIGQPDAARLTSAAMLLDGGFWPTLPHPAPPCPADFNGDGDLNPDDLADYLGAFFASPPSGAADFNADGETNPDDLADFIGAYFAGC